MRMLVLLLLFLAIFTNEQAYAAIDCDKDYDKLTNIQKAWCTRKARLKKEDKVDTLYDPYATIDSDEEADDEGGTQPKSFWGLENEIKEVMKDYEPKNPDEENADLDEDEEETSSEESSTSRSSSTQEVEESGEWEEVPTE